MYSNILIPVVFDDDHDTKSSFEAAQKLAAPGASFTVMHVMETIPNFAATQIPDGILKRSQQQARENLEAAAEALPGASTVMSSGHVGRQIVGHATKNGIDCIMVASHVPGLENVFIGSTADWVVRHAKCAVHVIR